MKKVQNATIIHGSGKPLVQDDKDVMVADICITALEQGKNLGFKVFRTCQKVSAMAEAKAPYLLLEDSEFDGILKAIKAGPFLDFVAEQTEDIFAAAETVKIEVK